MKKINISVHHECVFTHDLLSYSEGDVHECPDIDLGKINQSRLLQVIRECCTFPVVGMYYSASKKDLSKHLKPIRNDEELANFIKTAFENGGKVDLFVKHHGYDVIANGQINSTTLKADELEYNGVDERFKVKEGEKEGVDEGSKSKPNKWTKPKIKKLNSHVKGTPKSKGTPKFKGTPKSNGTPTPKSTPNVDCS
ncbi:hypothetical protein Tco_1575348 [Tanacetum coccineum]